MAVLIPIARLKPRLNIPVGETAYDELLEEAINIGEARASDFLRSPLRAETSKKAIFDIKMSNYFNKLGEDGYYTLVLKERFIAPTPIVTLKDPRGDKPKSDECIFDFEKGVILFPCKDVIRMVEVEYDCSGVLPIWVEDLVLDIASEVYALPDEEKRQGERGGLANLPNIYAAHHKQIPFAIRPIM